MTRTEIVKLILTYLPRHHHQLKTNSQMTYSKLAQIIPDAIIEYGRNRACIICSKLNFVVKLPCDNLGVIQNQTEYSYRDDIDTPTIFASHSLFGISNFILVSEYAASFLERIDDILNTIELNKPADIDWRSFLQAYETNDYLTNMALHALAQCIDSFDLYDDKQYQRVVETSVYTERFSDILINICIKQYNYSIVDKNIANIGLIDNRIVIRDIGIDDLDSYRCEHNEQLIGDSIPLTI